MAFVATLTNLNAAVACQKINGVQQSKGCTKREITGPDRESADQTGEYGGPQAEICLQWKHLPISAVHPRETVRLEPIYKALIVSKGNRWQRKP